MIDTNAEERLVKRALRDIVDGALDASSIADTVVRIAEHQVFRWTDVKPGFVPMAKKPTKDGVMPVQFVDSPLKVGAAAAKRRRRNTVRAPGLPKARERTQMGYVGVSDGKMRDHRMRKSNRARRYINWFLNLIDVRLSHLRTAERALVIRDEMNQLLNMPNVRDLFTSKERRRFRDVRNHSAWIVRQAHAKGIL